MILVLLCSFGVFMFTDEASAPTLNISDRPQDTTYTEEAYKNKQMEIETYIGAHISELSPVQEVLGGTFYVTEVTAANGKGVAKYEDGHMSYIADFTYTASNNGYEISKFKIRD